MTIRKGSRRRRSLESREESLVKRRRKVWGRRGGKEE
jgi:hypothetical protein